MLIWLLIAFDVFAVGVAVVLAVKLPHDPWRITPSLVVMFLLTIMLGAVGDPRSFLLTAGIAAAFGTGRVVHRLRRHSGAAPEKS